MAYQIIWPKIQGNLRGSLPTITQGSTLETLTIAAFYSDGSGVTLTGKTLTATATDEAGNTTSITGVLTGGASQFTWALSEGDIGTDGIYTLIVTYTDGSKSWASDPARFTVLPNPAADAVQNPALVGIGAEDAAWVAAGSAGGALGDAAYEDATAFDAAGSAAAVKVAAKIEPGASLAEAQAIVDAATGYSIFIAPGNHQWNGALQVPSNTHIFGAGNSTIITLAAGSNSDLITNSDWANGNTGILIENLYLDGNRANQAHAPVGDGPGQSLITFVNVSKSTIRGVHGTSPYFHGIDLNVRDSTANSYGDPGCTDIVVDNCMFTDFGDDGISPHWSSGIVISNCICYGAAATYSGSSNGFECDDGSHDVTLSNCIAYGNVNGFMVQGHASRTASYNITFVGCYAHSNTTTGWRILRTNPVSADLSRSVVLSACRSFSNPIGYEVNDYVAVTFTGCISDTDDQPIKITNDDTNLTSEIVFSACQFINGGYVYLSDTDVNGVTFVGCTFKNIAATYALVIASPDVSVIGCTLTGANGGGVQTLATADNVQIVGNKIIDNLGVDASGSGINLKGTSAMVVNNIFRTAAGGRYGIYLNGAYNNQLISGNRVSGFTHGIQVSNVAGVALIHSNILPGNTNAVTIAAGSGGNTVFSDNIGYP